jgi:hypothetical protein
MPLTVLSALDQFGSLSLFHMNFRIFSTSMGCDVGVLIRLALIMKIAVDSMAILTMLIHINASNP